MGTAQITAGYLHGVVLDVGAWVTDAFTGVPPVTVTVVPPGWSPGDPLDPARGQWQVALSTDATSVTSGGTVDVPRHGDQHRRPAAANQLLRHLVADVHHRRRTGFDGEALPDGQLFRRRKFFQKFID